ncbi:MAG: OmpH family outer membrane protein, partial [Prevotella sp.]|nr:OmpH family outer membrane protein [Prevotella sp.]
MKKTFIFAFAALLGLASCNNQPQQNDTKETKAPSKESSDVKIAYVEVDSIMSQYTYWKEVTKLMEQKEQNIQKTLATKQQSLQQAAAKFQQDIQANKYTQQQAQQVQASIQKQAQDAEGLQQRLGNEYQKLVADYNKA